jgi:hypothetical protein
MTTEELISALNRRTGRTYTIKDESNNFYTLWYTQDNTKHGIEVKKEKIHNTVVTSFEGKKLIDWLSI